MSSAILRSRLASVFLKHRRRLLSSNVVSGAPKEPLAPSSATAGTPLPPPPNTATTATASTDPPGVFNADTTSSNKPWRFLKYGLIGALTGASATAGYASYAYTFDEIDEKTRALRSSVDFSLKEDASTFDNVKGLLHSAAMIGLYWVMPKEVVDLLAC